MLKALRHLGLLARIAWLEYRQHSAQADIEGFTEAVYLLQLQMKVHADTIAAWDREIAELQNRLPLEALPRIYGDTL